MAVLGIVLGYPWHFTRIPKDHMELWQALNGASQGDAQDLSRHCLGCPRRCVWLSLTQYLASQIAAWCSPQNVVWCSERHCVGPPKAYTDLF